MREQRTKPRIPAARIIQAALVMFAARLGSLNALEQGEPTRWARRWLGGDLPSADTMGRVAAGLAVDDLRAMLREHYRRRKRMKTLNPVWGGKFFLILDGHEASASYRRCCPQCCTRTIETPYGKRTQYYHRYVAATLLHADGVLALDLEPQRPGEDEIAAAQRLLARLLDKMPRAFDVVMGDALYLHPDLCKAVRRRGKHFIAVLKNENRELIRDARGLFAYHVPLEFTKAGTAYQCWDLEGFSSWSSFDEPVRVVRAIETRQVKRQLAEPDEPPEVQQSEWLWATSLPQNALPTQPFIAAAHARWHIENSLFNELCTRWHADHLYKHEPNAIIAFLLLLFLAFNLVYVFLQRNLKPQLRSGRTTGYWLANITAAFYTDFCRHPP